MSNNINKLHKLSVIYLILIIINCFVFEIDGKRSFSVRIRSKNSGRSNSRRKSTDAVHVPSPGGKDAVASGPSVGKSVASKPVDASKLGTKSDTIPDSTNTRPIGWTDNNNRGPNPAGPPPAYPGLGNNPAAPHGAPPAYSASGIGSGPSYSAGTFGNPPSYAASQHAYRNQRESIPSGTHGYGSSYPYNSGSNIQSIPPRGQSSPYGATGIGGVNGATTFQGLGTGHNSFGGPSASGPSYNNYAGNNGGLYNGMGTYGNNNMGGGMVGGGYGGGYGYGQQSSNSGFSFGNVLAGAALWNIARGHNHYPSPSHNQNVHVHNHYDNNNRTDTDIPPKDSTAPLNNTPPTTITTMTTTTISPQHNSGNEYQQNIRRTSTTSTQLTQP